MAGGNGDRMVRRVAARQRALEEDGWVRALIGMPCGGDGPPLTARHVLGGCTRATLDRLCSLHVITRRRTKWAAVEALAAEVYAKEEN